MNREDQPPVDWGKEWRPLLLPSGGFLLLCFFPLSAFPEPEGRVLGAAMEGVALALLLAGPAVSLPSLLVIRSVLGARRTGVFTLLVVVMASATGLVYGAFFR
jgi:uncharacterized membrane protein YraQ (UPF0718 family)